MRSTTNKAEMEKVSIQDLVTEIIQSQNNIILEEEVKTEGEKKPNELYNIWEEEEEEEEGWVKDPECKNDLENLTPSYTYLPPLAYIPPEYLD